MARIIALCGKICSGKTFYANSIKDKENAVILSCDELTKDLFDNNLGDKHDETAAKIQGYLKRKAAEIVKAGSSVILDWGFWSRSDRISLTEYYRSRGITCEWHYIKTDDETWNGYITRRNERVLSGEGGSDYYLDEGLMKKLMSKWEEPAEEETDIIVHNEGGAECQ